VAAIRQVDLHRSVLSRHADSVAQMGSTPGGDRVDLSIADVTWAARGVDACRTGSGGPAEHTAGGTMKFRPDRRVIIVAEDTRAMRCRSRRPECRR
jgi:hypothetical protein